ncbi:MAG TPA: HPF/RaiA family ribosome-associated protein [bacterium]
MEITVAFRHMSHRNDMREYLILRLKKVEKLLKDPIQIRAIIAHEKYRFELSLNIKSHKFNFNVTESGEDWHSVIDSISSVAENVARKERDRLKKRRVVPKKALFGTEVTNDDNSKNKIKLKEKIVKLKPMALSEAMEHFSHNNEKFFIFIDVTKNNVKIIHKKRENSFEVLAPELA